MSEIQECVLYRDMEHGEILLEMAKLMDALSDDRKDPDSLKPVFLRWRELTAFREISGMII